ncbi:MAG TPA: ABC transporter family substrate-binding protein, partial [Gordonia sp. (in: high G+C Gram-positive bacteria)]|nr:ABC transporter family substrate-binding protein [Gordonia sp. (in: high G+C Gram-positive bacteria)]
TSVTQPPRPPRGDRITAGIGPVVKDGKQLEVRVGAVSTDPRAVAAAAAITDQLRNAGVLGTVVRLPNSELYSSALTGSRVDLVVGWSDGSIAPATALASLVDCDQPKTGEQEKKPGPGGTDESGFISNISGLCDAELITLARQALSAPDPDPLLDEAEGLLAQAAIYLPIYQDAALVVVTDEVFGVPLTGPVQTSIFAGAARWALPQ